MKDFFGLMKDFFGLMKDFFGLIHKLFFNKKVMYFSIERVLFYFSILKLFLKLMSNLQNYKNKNVIISNSLNRSAQGLSLSEKRILFLGIAKINGKNQEVVISAQDYSNTYSLTLDNSYKQLKSASNNLFNRYFTFQAKDKKSIGLGKGRWIESYKYFDQEGYIKLSFSNIVYPYLFELEREFTRYKLEQACALRSVYSWRFIELFEQYKQTKWCKIPIEEFWHLMEAQDSYRQNFSLLRQFIIERAVKELTEKTNYDIQWSTIKRGRKVVMLSFNFQNKTD